MGFCSYSNKGDQMKIKSYVLFIFQIPKNSSAISLENRKTPSLLTGRFDLNS